MTCQSIFVSPSFFVVVKIKALGEDGWLDQAISVFEARSK